MVTIFKKVALILISCIFTLSSGCKCENEFEYSDLTGYEIHIEKFTFDVTTTNVGVVYDKFVAVDKAIMLFQEAYGDNVQKRFEIIKVKRDTQNNIWFVYLSLGSRGKNISYRAPFAFIKDDKEVLMVSKG